MRHLHALALQLLLSLSALSHAADIRYVTDIGVYSLLAPCVANAVSDDIGAQTYSAPCSDADETKLQSCICSNTAKLQEVQSSISTDVLLNCGSSATDDLSSAFKMMSKYCNQDATISFFSPTTNIVSAYITDLPQMGYLPPCAQSALGEAVMYGPNSRCPEDAELFAPCVCSKSAVVSDISQTIRSSVKYSCSDDEDVTSAQKFYHEYCAMNQGTTSFAKPKKPPGDMTYYITALSQYKKLKKCARDGLSEAVQDQSSSLCGSGPQALASCVCLKSGMSDLVSTMITSEVKYSCDSTALADMSSAFAVWEYYCSAARSEVVATVTESVSQSYPTASSGNSPTSPPHKTSSSKPTSSSNEEDSGGGISKVAPIAGGIAGVVVVIGLLIGILFWLRKKQQQKKVGEQLPNEGPPEYTGTPELMGSTHVVPGKMPSPYLSPGASELATPNTSPRPDLASGFGPPPTELPPTQRPTPELQGQAPRGPAPPYTHHNYHQQQGPYGQPQVGYAPSPVSPHQAQDSAYGFQPSPIYGQQPGYGVPSQPPPAHGGWQSGPIEMYELDSGMNRGR